MQLYCNLWNFYDFYFSLLWSCQTKQLEKPQKNTTSKQGKQHKFSIKKSLLRNNLKAENMQKSQQQS